MIVVVVVRRAGQSGPLSDKPSVQGLERNLVSSPGEREAQATGGDFYAKRCQPDHVGIFVY